MKNVWLLGGGSGHGFKHGPALGEMMAGLILKDVNRTRSGGCRGSLARFKAFNTGTRVTKRLHPAFP